MQQSVTKYYHDYDHYFNATIYLTNDLIFVLVKYYHYYIIIISLI